MLFRKKKTYTFTYGFDRCFCKIEAYDRNSAVRQFKQQYKHIKNFTIVEDD